MRLFYANGTISIAVAIALHEASLKFEAIPVNFREAEQTKPEYLKLNPKGRVPTLEVEGALLTETGALLEYIAAQAPQANLIPRDDIAAAKMRGVMYYLASTMHVNHAHGLRGTRWADNPTSHADMAAKMPQTMTQSAHYLEHFCLQGPLMMGSDITLADPYAFVVCSWLKGDGVDMAEFPKINRFMTIMQERPSVRQVISAGMLTL